MGNTGVFVYLLQTDITDHYLTCVSIIHYIQNNLKIETNEIVFINDNDKIKTFLSE